MLKLLVTSVGSLVGQNILDVLESPICNRRDLTRVIGTNSIASNPQNFRCDRTYYVSNSCSEKFRSELMSIVEREKPDLILSGRDEDTEIVFDIVSSNPNLKTATPYGSLSTIQAALYKDMTSEFCRRHQLPFAASLIVDRCTTREIKEFAEKYGFPLIAKPVDGFASKGVFYLRTWNDIEHVKKRPGYIIQEYLGDPKQLESYFSLMDGPAPLFAHAPNVFHLSCHMIINPDGTVSPVFISRNEHDSGVTVAFQKISHSRLESFALRFAEAIIKENGHGPVTVQFRQDKEGVWKAQEINMRTNGNTYPRFLLGQDDIGLIVRGLFPSMGYPVFEASERAEDDLIGKTLTSYVMRRSDIEILRTQKRWP